MTISRPRLLVVLAAAVTGCLPRGAPPAGRQIIADRHTDLAALVPPDGDGVLRMLVTKPGDAASSPSSKDLYVVALDAAGNPTSQLLLAANFDDETGLGCNFGVAPCTSVQPRSVLAYTTDRQQIWVDPVTGDPLYGTSFQFQSPSGQRTYVSDQSSSAAGFGTGFGTTSSGTLHEADGSSTVLDDVTFPTFTDDDDFFYETSAGDLMDVPPSRAPEQVDTGLVPPNSGQPGPAFRAISTPDGTLLILSKVSSDANGQQPFVRDPLTGQETPLPSDNGQFFGMASPDGRWLVDTSETSQGRLTFIDYRGGTTDVVDLSTYLGAMMWRPGHNELWVSGETAAANTWVLTPGSPPVVVPGLYLADKFTPDGVYWLSTPDFNTSTPRTLVGPADDPTGPSFQLNPAGTYANPIWMLPDDRILGAVYVKAGDYMERTDAVVLDPLTGNNLTLGERGRIAAVGQTRMMGMFHFHEERGDLTVSEFATGRQTILAPEFATTAFADLQGADQLAPGASIVYQFQARTDSPYDGIWIVPCP